MNRSTELFSVNVLLRGDVTAVLDRVSREQSRTVPDLIAAILDRWIVSQGVSTTGVPLSSTNTACNIEQLLLPFGGESETV